MDTTTKPAGLVTDWTVTVAFNNAGSSLSFNAKTLALAIAGMFTEATYYLGHYKTASGKLEEYCAYCNGAGQKRIQRPRSVRYVKCKWCRGHKGPFQVIDIPEIKPHSNVVSIDNGTGQTVDRVAC